MVSPLKSVLIFLVLTCINTQYPYQLAPTTACPLLCTTYCNPGSTCSLCYTSFASNSSTSQQCACPQAMYMDSTAFCKPCPIYCQTCLNYTLCTSCITGYNLKNNYSCILNNTNFNGWVSKNVTYQLAGPDYTGISDLVVLVNGSNFINMTNNPQNLGRYLGNCSKFSPDSWLGGHQLFNFRTKVIKTVFNLPPHQWLNVMFQAMLIDYWYNNTLVVEVNSQQNYNPNLLQFPSVIWSNSFDCRLRTYDFCGNASVSDNFAIVNAWAAHNASSLKLQIRLNESESTDDPNYNLKFLWFGIRQLYIRVGTCGRNCRYCQSPSFCTQCSPPYIASSSGACICDSSFGIPTLNGCSFSCAVDQYFNQTANDCVSCNEQYDNCNSCNMTQCLSCNPGYLYFEEASGNVKCLRFCPNNYTEYKSYPVTYNQTVNNTVRSVTILRDQCVACSQNCLTCNNYFCIFCYSSYQYLKGVCVKSCPIETYSSSGSCILCPSNCSTCNSNGCTNCSLGYVLQNNRCFRQCSNSVRVLNTSAANCNVSCISPCLSCFGPTGNQCLTCTSGLFSFYNGSCLTSCPQRFYAQTNVCKSCPNGCSSCTDASTCLTCVFGYFMFSNQCVRFCPHATYPYFANATSNQTATSNVTESKCLSCPTGCQRCSDSNTCLQCNYKYNYFNFTCLQEDPDDFQPWEGHYRKCSANCLKCTHKICTRCRSNYFLNQGACTATCPPQKYPRSVNKYDFDQRKYQENICAWKSPLCSVYNNTLQDGTCSKCSFTFPASVMRQGWWWQPNNLCSFSCPQYYAKADNLTCVKCPQRCLRCFPNMTCFQCEYGYSINSPNLLNSSNIINQTCLLNVCAFRYFSDSLQCQSCPSGCIICLLDNSCFICDINYVLDPITHLCLNKNCSQFNQFFDATTNSCFSCSSNCRNCFNQSTFCTSCPYSSSVQTYLYSGSCLSSCPTGYFAHRYSLTCRLCNPRCSSCTNFDNCLTCKPNFYILSFYSPQNAQCIAECPLGFWTNTTICQRCFPDCKSCYGPSQYQCLSCYPNFYLDDYKCVYSCSPMKYKDNQGHCDWCHPSCQQCTGPSKYDCINCPSSQFYHDHRCYNQSCPGATFLSIPELRICEPCQYGCTFCSSSQFCYFCTSGFKHYRGWCYNQCPGKLTAVSDRYYKQLTGEKCRSCKYVYSQKCLSCDRTCMRCSYGYYLNRAIYISGNSVLEQCFSSCPLGTFPRNDGGRECVNCSASCASCDSYSNCVKCNSDYRLINGYCTTKCPAYTYQVSTSSSSVCMNCPSLCLSCINITSCTSCLFGSYLLKNITRSSCLYSCPNSYYADSSGWCVRCSNACTSCSSIYKCTSCQVGYSLINGVCSDSTTNNTCTASCLSCSGGSCLTCNSSYLIYNDLSSGSITCESSCPYSWYSFAGKCSLCNFTCATCSNSQNNCTSCVSGLYLYQQSCLPICPTGYYTVDSTLICQSCPQNCITCNNGNCTKCASGFFMYQGFCNNSCPATTFASLSTQMCFSCNDYCISCLDIQNCTVCAQYYSLFNYTCLSSCPPTTYQLNNTKGQVCMLCVSPCFTCTSSDTCSSCIGGYILNGTICQQSCGDGYFLQSYYIDYDIDDHEDEDIYQDYSKFVKCLKCNIECLTCRDYASRCVTCAVGFVLANGRCMSFCPDGTYNASSVCKPCSRYCVTCSNLNSCAVCVQGTVLYSSLCLSNCPQGYYMTLNSTAAVSYYYCTGCSVSCQSCNGSAEYNCLSCNSGLFLTNGMCLSACPQGTYATNLTRTCSPCPLTCTNCTSFSNCGACIVNYTLSNTNQCNPPTYITCDISNCVSCTPTNSYQCLQCITNYYLLANLTCSASCPTNTYALTGQCIKCPSTCSSCTATQCLSCLTSYYLYQGSCLSSCPISTLPSQTICVPDPCLYYSTQAPNSCLACTTPYLLATKNTSTGYQSCMTSCPAATTQSGSQCVLCPLNCKKCQTSSICTECNSTTYLNQGQCAYSCPIGTYSSGSLCKTCNISLCVQCNGPNNCTKCSAQSNAFLYNWQCYLNCPSGTYNDFNTGLCSNCSASCKNCTSNSYCTSCNTNYYYYQGSCLTACPVGTYNSSTKICLNCTVGCDICSSAASCSSCQAGFIYHSAQNSCLTSCPAGYYSDLVQSTTFTNSTQYQCLACLSPCLTCTSPTICLSCNSGTYFNRGSCLTACPAGTYQTTAISSSGTSQLSCLPCDSTCLTCLNIATYCITCPSGYILDTQGNCNSNCTNSSTYYYSSTSLQCLNCSGSCYSCQGPLSTDCLSCNPPLALYSGSCLTTCPFGYYRSSTYVCKQCSAQCSSCSVTANNCTSCPASNLLQTAGTGSICSPRCAASFYPNTTSQICKPCNSTCFNCTGPASDQCTSCPSGKIFSAGSCISSCPSGSALVQQGTQSICQPCSPGCLNCSISTSSTQASNCTVCQPNYYLYSGSCLTACPAGTYASATSYTCELCGIMGCQTCIFNTSLLVECTSCQAGYYPLGNTGVCITTCPTAYSLTNGQCLFNPTCQQYFYNGACIESCPISTYPVTSPTKTCLNCSTGCYSCFSESSCLQCSNKTFLYLNSTYNTSSCLTYCPYGFYGDSNTGSCISCGSSCSSCYLSNDQITCTSCKSGVLLGSQCSQSCPTGYFSSLSICRPCASICLSCVGSASNCTQCKNINYTAPSCSNPNCNLTQYLTASGSCANCHSACATCYGANSYECISCSSATFNFDGQCLTSCPQGTTNDSSRNCVTCPNNCATCSSTNSSQCTQCSFGYLLVQGTIQCVHTCDQLSNSTQTYYFNGSYCLACSLTNCLVCLYANNTVQCQTCQNNAYSYNNTCLIACPYSTYPSTNPNTCNKCSTNCLNCTSDVTCLFCSSGYALVGGSCTSSCSSGFYLSTVNSITTCSSCTANCISCTSASVCSSCAQPYMLVANSCTGCLPGYYYLSTTGTCLMCSSPCSTCSLTSTNCTTCPSGYSLFNSSTCLSTCPAGYYSSNSICTPCSTSNCAFCTSNTCTSCLSSYIQLYSSSGDLSCVLYCPAGNFMSSTTSTCISCSSQCLTCSSATFCTQCNSTYLLYTGYCISSCPSGFVEYNYTCKACPVNCKICSSLTTCTTCISGAYYIVNGVCTTNISCGTGYYANSNGNCSQCYPNCLTCNGGLASNCLSCFSGLILSNGACIQSCDAGAYFDSNSLACQSCNALFSYCTSCNSTNCNSCSPNYTLISNVCTLTCPSGTYQSNNQQCLSCSTFCSVCSTLTNCTQCIEKTFLISGVCLQSCPVSTYQTGSSCSACFQTCLTCNANSSTSCTSCISQYNYYQNSCLVTCPNGTYSSNSTCQSCSDNCLLCDSTGCTQCFSSLYLINGTCRSTCPTGYYLDTSSARCLQCVPPCTQCSSRNNCTACSSSYTLSGSTCLGQCPSGQYYNSSLSSCINCSMTGCGYCTATSCSACLPSYYSYYSNGVISACILNCSNIYGVYNDNGSMNCSSCFSNCQNCANATYCNLCNSGYYLLSPSGAIVNECVTSCPLSYFATLLRTCTPCGSSCNVCSNSTYCEVCASNYYLFTTQTANITNISCLSQCPTGYSNPNLINGQGRCTPCSTNCVSCVDNENCTQCTTTYYALSSGQCIPYNCLNCQNCNTGTNVCRNCTSPFFINNGGCVKFCPNGYYGNSTTGACNKCMENCNLCFNSTNCTQCSDSHLFVQSTLSCQNQGYVEFGPIGNISGFTSNITEVMATLCVSTSAGPIMFGALANTYGMMGACQYLYFLQGSCGDNPEISTFLLSLSKISYTSSNTNQNSSNSAGTSSRRLLTGMDYTSSFLETNLPIFLMMIGFLSAYVLVVVLSKYNESCCVNYPTALKYLSYICQFMKKRFKYIYVDCIMWISYLPFLYFSLLQIQKMKFDTALNAISTIIAFVIILVYPLYPIFILKKIFDKSSDPQEHLINYSAITLRLPLDMEQEEKKSACEGVTCCPKQNPDVSMVQMSLSPWIDSVVRPVYNQDVPQYSQFKYFTIPHFRLAYAAIKYIRKLIFVLVVALCPDPKTTLAILIGLNVVYMLYLIILRPKQKLYLILQFILQFFILFFLVFMLIYLNFGGATITTMSIMAHGIGFLLANCSLAIAIILNLMSYYTIICCIVDLVRHIKNKAEADDIKEKKQQQINQFDPALFNEKDQLPANGHYQDYPEDGAHMDLEKDLIKKFQAEDKELQIKEKNKRGPDQMTQENDEDYPVDQFILDEKEFNFGGQIINIKGSQTYVEGADIPNLEKEFGVELRKKQSKRQSQQFKYQGYAESETRLGKANIQDQQTNQYANNSLRKQRESDKYNKKLKKNELNDQKGRFNQPAAKLRNSSKKNSDLLRPEQQSMDLLFVSPNGKKNNQKFEQVEDATTQDRLRNFTQNNGVLQGQTQQRRIRPKQRKINQLEQISLRQREIAQKQKQKKTQQAVQNAKPIQRERNKKQFMDSFGEFQEILQPKQKKIEDLELRENQKKSKENVLFKQSIVSNFLAPEDDDFQTFERNIQPKKKQNVFYKPSDDEDEADEVKTKEKQPMQIRKNKKKFEMNAEPNIEGVGIDVNRKKQNQKQQPGNYFAEDKSSEVVFKEKQGKGFNNKFVSRQQQQSPSLEQLRGKQREKVRAQRQVKPSIYSNSIEQVPEASTFNHLIKVKQPKSLNELAYEEQSSYGTRKKRQELAKKQKDDRLRSDFEQLQYSYDVTNKSKQQIFKQGISKVINIDEDQQEQALSSRAQNKRQIFKSKNKDSGLSASNYPNEEMNDAPYDSRRQKIAAAQRLQLKGNMQLRQAAQIEEETGSRDQRRISKVQSKKSKSKNEALHINKNSEDEDIQEYHL